MSRIGPIPERHGELYLERGWADEAALAVLEDLLPRFPVFRTALRGLSTNDQIALSVHLGNTIYDAIWWGEEEPPVKV